MSTLKIVTDGDTCIVATRRFRSEPELVYRAHVETDLIKRWLTGPEGWSITECFNEPVPGGAIRYAWADSQGNGFRLTGEFIELVPFSRIVHVERMHLAETTPDNRVETRFEPDGEGGTLVTLRMSLPDGPTRDAMLASGMEHGMEASYAKLDQKLTPESD